jgi:putative thiamine transport system permease protein
VSISRRAHRPRKGWLIPATIFCVPLIAALWFGISDSVDLDAWRHLLADSQFPAALRLSLQTGIASTLIAAVLAMSIVGRAHGMPRWHRLTASTGGMLALPHAAFAIGLALLLMPSGAIARVVAWLAGWTSPPDVVTVQDPAGIALIIALVLKETPFLVWNAAAQLQREGQGDHIEKQLRIAATMGYSRSSGWMRIVWPQLLPRLALSLVAVWAYGLTVVDMALVLGPTHPPTLGLLAWRWLLDADEAMNRQGAAAALLLSVCVAIGACLAVSAWKLLRPALMLRWTRGDRPASRAAAWPWQAGLRVVYIAVVAMLLFISIAGVWTFPAMWPASWSAQSWITALASASTWADTLALALASAATGLVLAIAWMETTPASWDSRAAPFVFAPMLVPGVLLVSGLYQLALRTGSDGSLAGIWLAHSVYAAPYVLVALAPAYRSFDPRIELTALALGKHRAAMLWHVKWPMLRQPIAAAFAVGFAVSVAQYLSTQFVGAGRHATLTTEALTLASGGQRSLSAAFALLQAALPALMFLAVHALARRRTAN